MSGLLEHMLSYWKFLNTLLEILTKEAQETNLTSVNNSFWKNSNTNINTKKKIQIHNQFSQLVLGDHISHNYVSCTAWNYVNAYFFCLPWFIFLGEVLHKYKYKYKSFFHLLLKHLFVSGMNVDRLYAVRHPMAYVNAVRRVQ